MAVAATSTVSLLGVQGQLVRVEADLSAGLPGLSFTGLAGTAVIEARDRIRAAVINSGASWPARRITLALLPADVRKSGSQLDLAMAVAVLAAAGAVPADTLARTVWLAEVGLDGALRAVRGVLPAVIAARAAGCRQVVVAAANAAEAALLSGIPVYTATHLSQVIASLIDPEQPLPRARRADQQPAPSTGPDLADIAGQSAGRRAVEVAAAGGHHLFLRGVPGAGKTMLIERLPGLLPPLDDDAALEVTAIHSVAGRLSPAEGLVRQPPFQAPHHCATLASVVGGGSGLAGPGAISLAHRGVLFLDEAPQFDPRVLDALRQPLESGSVTVHRSAGAVTYPSRFLLALAANPCPCGKPERRCECPSTVRRRYGDRLSRPLLDRIDINVWVDPIARADLFDDGLGTATAEASSAVAVRVATARAAAAQRWAALGWSTNGEALGPVLRRRPWRPPSAVLRPAERQLSAGRISARGFDKVLRLAWTLADLAGRSSPSAADVAEAVFLRLGREQAWAA